MIRLARGEDAAAIAAIYAAEVLGGATTFETDPPDARGAAAWMSATDGHLPWLVTEEAGAVLGYAYAGPYNARPGYRWTVSTTIYLAAEARGRGLGRALYAALIDRLTAQGLAQAVARILAGNIASERLHVALGFRRLGTIERAGWRMGRWIDVDLWQRALADPGDPPLEPMRVADVVPSPSPQS